MPFLYIFFLVQIRSSHWCDTIKTHRLHERKNLFVHFDNSTQTGAEVTLGDKIYHHWWQRVEIVASCCLYFIKY